MPVEAFRAADISVDGRGPARCGPTDRRVEKSHHRHSRRSRRPRRRRSARLRRHCGHFRFPRSGLDRRARRRARYPRGRPPQTRKHRPGDRRHRAIRWLGARAGRRGRRTGLACRTGPRFENPRGGYSNRSGRDLLRSAQRRQQGMGALPALSRSRLRRSVCGERRFRAGQRRRRPRRDDSQFQGRARLRFRANRRRRHGRSARGGQCRRQRDRWRRTVVLGGAVRNGKRVRRARTAAFIHEGHAQGAAQGRSGMRRLRKTPRWWSWSRMPC